MDYASKKRPEQPPVNAARSGILRKKIGRWLFRGAMLLPLVGMLWIDKKSLFRGTGTHPLEFHGGNVAESGWGCQVRRQTRFDRIQDAGKTAEGPQNGPTRRVWHSLETHRTHRDRSSVRVRHHGFGDIVRKWVIQPGLDDPVHNLRRGPRWRNDAHTLFPQAKVAQDVLDHGAVVNQ